jgi:casein kinase II subunit beta
MSNRVPQPGAARIGGDGGRFGGGGGGGGMAAPNNGGAADDDSYSYEEEEDAEEDEVPWVAWFCGLKGNEFFCEVDEEYIRDDFNLTGLSLMVPFFDNAVEMILDLDSPQDERLTEEQQRLVDSSAETLYGLIHARFILTPRGLKLMEQKYRNATFGRCPRVSCGGHPVLSVGQSDVVRESSVKLYCPKCRELYFPRSTRHKALDGAFWGTTFPHLLLLTLYDGPPPIETSAAQAYVPRIFGFRVRDPRLAARSVDGPRMIAGGDKDEDDAPAAGFRGQHADPLAGAGASSAQPLSRPPNAVVAAAAAAPPKPGVASASAGAAAPTTATPATRQQPTPAAAAASPFRGR